MYLGAHGLLNSLHTVVDAAALLHAQGYADKVRFRFVGDGPRKPELIQQAERAGLDGMVRFEAPMPKRSVNDVMAEADIFILPLHQGGLFRWGISPNKLFDYMAAARPVVYRVDARPIRWWRPTPGWRFRRRTRRRSRRRSRRCWRCRLEERWEMGLRGRHYVEAHHDMARLAERFEACLQRRRQGRPDREGHRAPAHHAL